MFVKIGIQKAIVNFQNDQVNTLIGKKEQNMCYSSMQNFK